MTSDRTIDMTEGNKYEQKGNLGVGHQDGGEIKDNAKVAGHLEEKNHNQLNKNDIKVTVNIDSQDKSQVEETFQNNNRFSNTSKFEITLSGELTKDQRANYKGIEIEIEDLAEKLSELGIKHKLTINYVKQGSIKIGLEGHPEDFQKLQELFQSGQLNEILGIPVEDISLVAAENSIDKEKIENTNSSLSVEDISQDTVNQNSIHHYFNNVKNYFNNVKLFCIKLLVSKLLYFSLSGVNLSGVNLSGVNLSGVNLSGANLSGANLNGANLNGANLRGANLRGAKLDRVELIGTNLSGVNLRGADLREADLRGADLNEAKVENTRFGDNKGIADFLKQDLIRRGAIFEDSPGDRSKILTRV